MDTSPLPWPRGLAKLIRRASAAARQFRPATDTRSGQPEVVIPRRHLRRLARYRLRVVSYEARLW